MNNVRTRIAALVLTFVLLAPALFTVAEAQHDCQGDECQVCQVLAIASSIIQTAADVSAAASEAALFAAFVLPIAVRPSYAASNTLVELKARLDC